MTLLAELWGLFMPWIVFMGFVYLCIKMTGWAKNRKAGAIAFGLLVQMFIPDPKAKITIEAVAKQKQEVKKQQDGIAKDKDS
ncbi:hypothetical protein [Paraglaciecola sp.]|uniref:hypothetical protein n=1 Tax=Paraglaciecola sp. TaxID=1920173 RepID=UPI003EFA3361